MGRALAHLTPFRPRFFSQGDRCLPAIGEIPSRAACVLGSSVTPLGSPRLPDHGRRRPLYVRTSRSLPSLSSSPYCSQRPRSRPDAWPVRARSRRRCSGGSLPRAVSIALMCRLRRFILMWNHSASSSAFTMALYPRLSPGSQPAGRRCVRSRPRRARQRLDVCVRS